MIFVDTGAFVARYHAQDQFHGASLTSWDKLRKSGAKLYTSNFVLDETITLLGRRAGYGFAAGKARLIYASPSLTVLRPEAKDELRAVELFTKYADQEMSFTDCVSFALMSGHKIKQVFGYDDDFVLAGFQL